MVVDLPPSGLGAGRTGRDVEAARRLLFAGHKDPRTTRRNYFTEAAKVKPLR